MRKTKLTRKALALIVGLVPVMTAGVSAAYADCNPKCKNGDVCRHDQNAGVYYCAPPPTPRPQTFGGPSDRDPLTSPFNPSTTIPNR